MSTITPPAAPPAAATPPAAPTPPPPGNTPPGQASGDWTASLSDDHKGFVQNKGFKGPQDVLESYRNFEKLQGVPQDRLLKLPEKMDTPEGRAVWERLGAPKEAKDYGFDKLMPTDAKTAEWAAGLFHENAIPRGAAEKIISKWNERNELATTAAKEAHQNMLAQDEAKLKASWGQAYDANVNLVKAGARALGLDGDTLDVLEAKQGREALFTRLQKIGAGIGEADHIVGRPAGEITHSSPESAKAKIAELRGDQTFTKRYLAGETDAKNQLQKLYQVAYPGEITV